MAVRNQEGGFLVADRGPSEIRESRAIGADTASGTACFLVAGPGAVLERNVAVGCTIGFRAVIGSRFTNNAALYSRGPLDPQEGPGAGFLLFEFPGAKQGYIVEGNTSNGNQSAGFVLGGDPFNVLAAWIRSFRNNSAIGNVGAGIVLQDSPGKRLAWQ